LIEEILDNLSEICVANRLQIVTAESCTGGLVAKLITDRAGSSQWFERGFVTYSNISKQEMLGVDSLLLEQWGAVSEPVAVAMAEGALKHSQAQLALSITGIAGPEGGTASKPVGTVCFGWAVSAELKNTEHLKNELKTVTQHFSGDRDEVRFQSAKFALQNLYQLVLDSIKA
jgi:nicotinamide-nucleotide amidase